MSASCPGCGAAMRPLFNSFFCPNDCDRPSAVDPDEDVTVELCPKCFSDEVEPFSVPWDPRVGTHCIPCGAVWWDE